MAYLHVDIVGTHSTKAEEIKALGQMAKCVDRGSYLASLFTPAFIHWVETQIQDDGSADLYGYLEKSYQDVTAECSKKVSAEMDAKRAGQDYMRAQAAYESELRKAGEHVAYLETRIETARKDRYESAVRADKFEGLYHRLLQAIGWESKPEWEERN